MAAIWSTRRLQRRDLFQSVDKWLKVAERIIDNTLLVLDDLLLARNELLLLRDPCFFERYGTSFSMAPSLSRGR
jgi:hypothetical protein